RSLALNCTSFAAARNFAICCRLNFSVSCTLIIHRQHASPLRAHPVLETSPCFRLVLHWKRLRFAAIRATSVRSSPAPVRIPREELRFEAFIHFYFLPFLDLCSCPTARGISATPDLNNCGCTLHSQKAGKGRVPGRQSRRRLPLARVQQRSRGPHLDRGAEHAHARLSGFAPTGPKNL